MDTGTNRNQQYDIIGHNHYNTDTSEAERHKDSLAQGPCRSRERRDHEAKGRLIDEGGKEGTPKINPEKTACDKTERNKYKQGHKEEIKPQGMQNVHFVTKSLPSPYMGLRGRDIEAV